MSQFAISIQTEFIIKESDTSVIEESTTQLIQAIETIVRLGQYATDANDLIEELALSREELE